MAFQDAVNLAVDAGVTVVVAAGNENKDACNFSPAFVESAITVGATNSHDRKSAFSNWGSCVDIWAPGSSIPSASHLSREGTSTLDGTSMAAAHVAGAAAIALEMQPQATPLKVLTKMKDVAQRNA